MGVGHPGSCDPMPEGHPVYFYYAKLLRKEHKKGQWYWYTCRVSM